jgi:hypothetical protein
MSYYTNLSKNDLIISDVGIRIRAGFTENVRRLNPLLSDEALHESECIGGIYKAVHSKKMVKVPKPSPQSSNYYTQKVLESTKAIPSRARVGISIDPKKKQYIEELTGFSTESDISKFEDYADGFAEPDLDGEVDITNQPIGDQNPTNTSRYVDVKSATNI